MRLMWSLDFGNARAVRTSLRKKAVSQAWIRDSESPNSLIRDPMAAKFLIPDPGITDPGITENQKWPRSVPDTCLPRINFIFLLDPQALITVYLCI